jgi:hypothetical protein
VGHPLLRLAPVSVLLVAVAWLNLLGVLGGALRRQAGIWLVALGALGTLLVFAFTNSPWYAQRGNEVLYDVVVQG